MKLYIITSVLNIDNILSSESISPACFYERRNFGYHYFEIIPNLPMDKIVLFDFLPYMEIVDVERINYPLVIEINDPEQFSKLNIIKWEDGVFFSDKTVYINPFNCRVLFFSTEAYNEAKLRCSDSKTDKLYRYYQQSFVQKKEAKDISNISLPISEDVKMDDLIKTDERFNSQKGFLLGWYLGSGKNIDPVLAKLKSIEKKAYDYVSAIKNNSGVVTPAYREALNELDKQYKSYDPNVKKTQELWNTELGLFCSNNEAFHQFLRKYGMESELKNAVSRTLNIPHRRLYSIDKYELFMTEMTNYTNMLLKSSQPSYNCYDETDSDDSKLFSSLIKRLFLDNRFHLEDLRINRSIIARNFIVEIRQFMENSGRTWENSNEYKYLQSLMLNIIKSDPFELSSIQNDLLQSVAAFVLKGEDYDDMMSYLQNNAMGEFRYVLGFWSAACGYADMPRSITSVLFDSSDFSWCQVYKKIHKEVYGFELVGELNSTPEKTETHGGFWQGVKDIGQKIGGIFTGKEESSTVETDISIVHDRTEHRTTPIPEELKIMFDSEAFKKLSLAAQQYFKTESLKLYKGKIDKAYVDALKKLEYPKSKTNWQNAIKSLNQKQKKTTNIMQDTLSLFPVASTGSFLTDFDFLINNIEFRDLVSSINGWEKDLKWFIEAHNPNHEDYKYYQGKPIDNESVIKQFIFLKKEKYKSTESFLRKTYLK